MPLFLHMYLLSLAPISASLHPPFNFCGCQCLDTISHTFFPFPSCSLCHLKWSQVIRKQEKQESVQLLVPTMVSIVSIGYCWKDWLRDTSKCLVFLDNSSLLSPLASFPSCSLLVFVNLSYSIPFYLNYLAWLYFPKCTLTDTLVFTITMSKVIVGTEVVTQNIYVYPL